MTRTLYLILLSDRKPRVLTLIIPDIDIHFLVLEESLDKVVVSLVCSRHQCCPSLRGLHVDGDLLRHQQSRHDLQYRDGEVRRVDDEVLHLGVAETCGDDEGGLPVLVSLVDVLPRAQHLPHLLQVTRPRGLTERTLAPGHQESEISVRGH